MRSSSSWRMERISNAAPSMEVDSTVGAAASSPVLLESSIAGSGANEYCSLNPCWNQRARFRSRNHMDLWQERLWHRYCSRHQAQPLGFFEQPFGPGPLVGIGQSESRPQCNCLELISRIGFAHRSFDLYFEVGVAEFRIVRQRPDRKSTR